MQGANVKGRPVLTGSYAADTGLCPVCLEEVQKRDVRADGGGGPRLSMMGTVQQGTTLVDAGHRDHTGHWKGATQDSLSLRTAGD